MLVSLKPKFNFSAKSLISLVPLAFHNVATPYSFLNISWILSTDGAVYINLISIMCKCICRVGTLFARTNNGDSLPKYDFTSSP